MDFLDFENHELYFDEPMSAADQALLDQAAEAYPEAESENILQELHHRLPESLSIIVALYRFYYYQHRYYDALEISARAIAVSSKKLGLNVDWEGLTEDHLGSVVFVSIGLIRFYMLALKASAYLFIRVGEIEQGYARLKRIVELDPADQFGANFLYKIAAREMIVHHADKHNIESIYH